MIAPLNISIAVYALALVENLLSQQVVHDALQKQQRLMSNARCAVQLAWNPLDDNCKQVILAIHPKKELARRQSLTQHDNRL